MEFNTNRREFLALAGTGTAASLAGCNSLQDSSEPTEDASGGRATVTVALTPDQQKLQQRQREIQSELQAGNISRSEAQKQFRTAQNDLRSKAATSFSSRVGSKSNLEIENSIDRLGVFLVSGSAAGLIESLSFDEVNALLSEETFQQAKAQATQQNGTATASN